MPKQLEKRLPRQFRWRIGFTGSEREKGAGFALSSSDIMAYGCTRFLAASALLASHASVSGPGQEQGLIQFPQLPHDAPEGVSGRALPPDNLPTFPARFIGRDREIAHLVALIRDEDVRLLTLMGPGGVGKTRLALRAAEELLPQFEDGIFFVSLAPIADPALVLPTIAQTLGIVERGSAPLIDKMRQYLAYRDILLILDNFEQVVAAAAQVTALLPHAPGLRILFTSRTSLHQYGEHEYLVPPMEVPGTDYRGPSSSHSPLAIRHLALSYDAVQLFVARAREVQPRFALTDANALAIIAICDKLDGLPLALELAAVRIRILSPQALFARLDKRLALLTEGAHNLPARQRTLRAAIDWSYDLLEAGERTLFAALSVFAGGCRLEGTEAIATAIFEQGRPQPGISVLDLLTSLVSKSLLKSQAQTDGEPRFSMLETLREYALEKLTDSGSLLVAQQAHAIFYLHLAESLKQVSATSRHDEVIARLDIEQDNLRAALRWSLDRGESEVALRLVSALRLFWDARGHLVEGRRWFEEALALTESENVSVALRADAFRSAAILAQAQNDMVQAKAFTEESLRLHRILDDKQGIAGGLITLAVFAAEQDDYAQAASLFEQSLALWRELGDDYDAGVVLTNLSFLALFEHDYERAILRGEESVAVYRVLGSAFGVVTASVNLGLALLHRGVYDRSVAIFTENLAHAEALGTRRHIALLHIYLGLATVLQGKHAGAIPHYREGMIASQELGNPLRISQSLVGLAAIAVAGGQTKRAVLLNSAANALISAKHLKWTPAERALHERTQAIARERLGEAAFAEAWAQGQAMTQVQSIAYALEEPVPPPSPTPAELPIDIISEPIEHPIGELTGREVEVLRLVATGRTNKEIAERIVVSPRTVKNHLYSIFNKLNVTTRSAATRYAIEHRLV